MSDPFRLAIDTIPGLVWSSLPDGHIDFLNRRWLEYTGLPPEQATGRGWQAAVFPDDLPGLLAIWKRVLASGAPGETEARLRRHDGVYRWFLFRAMPLHDSAGTLVRWYGQTTDIEDRKRAEAMLSGEKRLLEMIAKGNPLAAILTALCCLVEELWGNALVSILLLDAQGRHLRHGAAPSLPRSYVLQVDGSPVDQTVGPCGAAAQLNEQVIVSDVAADARWPRFRSLALAHGLRACWSTPITAADGSVLGTFATYFREPGPPTAQQQSAIEQFTHLASIAIERMRDLDALRISEHRYALAMEATGDGHWDWNMPADKVYVSPLLLDMCGLPADTVFANRAEWVDRFPFYPGERAKYEQAVAEHFAGKTARLDMEIRILPRGETRWIHLTGRCSRDASGMPIRWAGSVTDVTDRHLAEDELQRMERQLRQAQRLEAMGTLAGGIAHDFNNLLGAILGYGEMALRDVPAGSRLRRDLDSIMIAGERGRALVDRILAFSRSGMSERVAVHVEDVVRETVGLFASKLPQDIGFETQLHAGDATVMGDATQIHQVLMNLVTNAAQAMPSGGTLRVSLDFAGVDVPRVVATGSLAAGDYVVLKVADTGGGIPPEILERIFDPFFTTKDVGVGTGLGLSLVHGIVTGLGGAVDVATTVAGGSTFTVYLPLAADIGSMGKVKSHAQPETRRGARERVLVVDDEAALVRLTTETLAELGYAPTGFTASATALAAFLADPRQFDAVVTDESMPGMSGSELIRRVRQVRPTVPILLVSGYLDTAVVRRAREAGADEVLKKPLSARDLASSLDRMLHATPRRSPQTLGGSLLTNSLLAARHRSTAAASQARPARRR